MTNWQTADWREFDCAQYRQDLCRNIPWEALLAELGIAVESRRSTGVLYTLSPFTVEKTPSCRFLVKAGKFRCFSSGAAGDKLDFVLLTIPCLDRAENLLRYAILEQDYFYQSILSEVEDIFVKVRRHNLNKKQNTLDID